MKWNATHFTFNEFSKQLHYLSDYRYMIIKSEQMDFELTFNRLFLHICVYMFLYIYSYIYICVCMHKYVILLNHSVVDTLIYKLDFLLLAFESIF